MRPPPAWTSRAERRRQRGLTLVELSIAASILMILTALAGARLMREVDDAAAGATGTYLLTVKGALDNYLVQHYEALSGGKDIPGYAAALAPTLAELRAAELLNRGFPGRTPFNQEVAVRISRGEGCPGAACRLDALAYTTTPLRAAGAAEPGIDLLALAVQAGGGYGGAAYPADAAVLRGATYVVPNPLGAVPGVVGALSNLDATMFHQFVRMRDSRNPDLQGGLDVHGQTTVHGGLAVRGRDGDCIAANGDGVLTVDCAGLLQARRGQFAAADGSQVQVDPLVGVVASRRVRGAAGLATDRGTVFDAGDDEPTIRANAGRMLVATANGPALAVAGQDLLGQAGVSATRLGLREVAVPGTSCAARISSGSGANAEFARTAGGGLVVCTGQYWRELAALADAGAACQPNGAFATDAGSGSGLVCRLGVWMRADDLFSSYVMVGSQVVGAGDTVAKPACGRIGAATGSALIYLLPQVESSQASSFARRAEDLGAAWRIHLLDYDGSALGGPPKAIAQIYCKY